MKVFFYAIYFAFLASAYPQTPEHYQLKIYTCATEDQIVNTDDYLKESFIPRLKESGIDYVGVFKPKEKDSTVANQTYVLIPFNSLSEFTILNNTYVREINKLNQNVDFLNPSNTKSPYQRIESVLIKADLDLPSSENLELKSRKEDRVYELISYKATAEDLSKKKEDLFLMDQKFKLLDEATFDEIFYGEVLEGYTKANLMYMTSYNPKKKLKPVSIVSNYTSKRDWRKMKRKQRRQLRKKIRLAKNTPKPPVQEKKLPVELKKLPNSITNLLFATEYSDF